MENNKQKKTVRSSLNETGSQESSTGARFPYKAMTVKKSQDPSVNLTDEERERFPFTTRVDGTKGVTESPQPDWKARTKPFVDNDLFVDFPEVENLKESDDYDEYEDDYYESPAEFFWDGNEQIVSALNDLETYLKQEPVDFADNKKLVAINKIKNSPELLNELKEFAIDKICNNDTLINYITDYTVAELGEMDGVWNEFGDALNDAVYQFVDSN